MSPRTECLHHMEEARSHTDEASINVPQIRPLQSLSPLSPTMLTTAPESST